MKMLKVIISVFLFCMIVSLFNTCYAATITKVEIEQALKDVEEGRYQTLEEFCAEMEETYDIK